MQKRGQKEIQIKNRFSRKELKCVIRRIPEFKAKKLFFYFLVKSRKYINFKQVFYLFDLDEETSSIL